MRLLQLKIRGLGSTVETKWIATNHQLTQLVFEKAIDGIHLLRAIETINPRYDCLQQCPFAPFPVEMLQHGYRRKLSPGKRTISMGVFGAPPKLVNELAEISDLLYATDRIEVGRRLDYSRWLNFVELASSTRWSEVMHGFSTLQKHVATLDDNIAAELNIYTSSLEPSTRIKGELMHQLNDWLERINVVPDDSLFKVKTELQVTILRALHFQDARTLITDRLPLVVHINETSVQTVLEYISKKIAATALLHPMAADIVISLINKELESIHCESEVMVRKSSGNNNFALEKAGVNITSSIPTMNVETLQIIVALCRAASKFFFKAEPILLFTIPPKSTASTDKAIFFELVTKTADSCQCICVTEEALSFNENSSCTTHLATEFTV